MSSRSRAIAIVLSMFGFLGLHRFYLGRFGTGTLMLLTFGGYGLWWLIDVINLFRGTLTDGQGLPLAWTSESLDEDTKPGATTQRSNSDPYKNYAKRTCAKCGLRQPQPLMRQETAYVDVGRSKPRINPATIIGMALGSDVAGKNFGRAVWGVNSRKYQRKKTVWLCNNC